MPSRQRVSAEAVERAIKAHLALACDVADTRITRPISISRAGLAEDGRNWALQTDELPDEIGASFCAAADAVARRLNLN